MRAVVNGGLKGVLNGDGNGELSGVLIGGLKGAGNGGSRRHALTETAFDAGYFDQPHFNKDFKLFTGQTPTDFLKSPIFW